MTDSPGSLDELKAALSDRYRLERELGEGGMATVYRAHDVKHNRQVAVKVLKPELAAVLGGQRFLKEIQVTVNLQHPHILPLYDSGSAAGALFYVMPVVRGESLRDRMVREKLLTVDDAIGIIRQIAGALDFAHRQGIIHRDIKPENILLQDGDALLSDFGIALAVSEAGGGRLTGTGMSIGTLQYMSPEQATSERDLDARSDIYALGAVAYEMLAGEPPLSGPTPRAMIAKLMTERPTPLHVVRDIVPASVDAAVMGALEKGPADRFTTARQFADALTVTGAAGAHDSGAKQTASAATAAGALRRRRARGLAAVGDRARNQRAAIAERAGSAYRGAEGQSGEPRRLSQGSLFLESAERREPDEGDRAVRRRGEAEPDLCARVLGDSAGLATRNQAADRCPVRVHTVDPVLDRS